MRVLIGVVLLLLAGFKAAGVLFAIATGTDEETGFLVKQALYAVGFAIVGVTLVWPRPSADEPPDESQADRPA